MILALWRTGRLLRIAPSSVVSRFFDVVHRLGRIKVMEQKIIVPAMVSLTGGYGRGAKESAYSLIVIKL
jgi:hypothetical protein